MAYLGLLFFALFTAGGKTMGLAGQVASSLAMAFLARALFRGFTDGEFSTMFRRRHFRTAVWALTLSGAGVALVKVEMEDRASGPFATTERRAIPNGGSHSGPCTTGPATRPTPCAT